MTLTSNQKTNQRRKRQKSPDIFSLSQSRELVSIFHATPYTRAICPFYRSELEKMLSVMLGAAKTAAYDLAPLRLHLVNDYQMATLNKQAMGLKGPTNILSFPGGKGELNELVLSLDTWQRESVLYGQNPEEYFILLLSHGMGHLAMLDHGPNHSALAALCAESAMANWIIS